MVGVVPGIEHVVVLMMENRSFDHMFGFLDRPSLPRLQNGDYPNPVSLGSPDKEAYGVTDNASFALPVDPPHSHNSVMNQINPRPAPHMDGFVAAYFEKASGKERVAKIHWRGIGAVLVGLATVACASAYFFGNDWRSTSIMALVLGTVPTLALWDLKGIWTAWSKMVLGIAVGAVSFGLLARAMRHEWWAAALVLTVLVAAETFVLIVAARRPLYVHPKDLADARKAAPLVMRCMPSDQIPALAKLARSFTVCTRWHSSVPGATWPNRNFAHAGTSAGTTDIEFGFYRDRTIFEVLDRAGKSWHIYHEGLAQLMAFPKLWRRKKRSKHWFHLSKFEEHVRSGRLPSYSFLEPEHEGDASNSQHPGNNYVAGSDGTYDFQRGEALIAHVYETLRAQSELFKRTLLLITYDEHGGLFDHCPPPQNAIPPGKSRIDISRWFISRFVTYGSEKFDFKTLGPRVPAVVVGPRVPSCVDNTLYDHSSIVATVRGLFVTDSKPLTDRDGVANSFDHLASLVEARDDLPDLSDQLVPVVEWGDPAIGHRAQVAATPIENALSSQLSRLARGVSWRMSVVHPIDSLRARRLSPQAPSVVRPDIGPTADSTETLGRPTPHARTVDRFVGQAERARRP